MPTEEIIKLNDEIEELEKTYIELKFDYETKKANILLHTDFGLVMGKAKPTVAEKDAFIKLECLEEEEQYKELGIVIASKKRLFEIMLRTIGDGE